MEILKPCNNFFSQVELKKLLQSEGKVEVIRGYNRLKFVSK